MDFGLNKFEVDGKIARFEVPYLGAVLLLRPATEANKPYFNQVLKRSKRRVNAVRRGNLDAKMLAEGREEDRELFPKYVIADWEGVTDKDGVEVPFSIDNCADFVRGGSDGMPDWMFDEIRNFASDIPNFIELMDVEGAVKN